MQELEMDSPAVLLQLPSSSLFKFPPSSDPHTILPSAGAPFSIPTWIYSGAFDVRIPITIACVYAVTVTSVNRYNKSRGNKAWPISKTRPFFWFVVAHNIFLAVYSAWTFVGMLGALRRTIKNPSGPAGLVGTVDSLCKMHGTGGFGNAVAYNSSLYSWVSHSPNTGLLSNMGEPLTTDVGRLWNEGLAFYGYFFYLSKFYEVLDTFIILAKGKRSSTLQTYHHAGAMMCMWAGIRFMSPPIWMFVFVNSGIHAMMYTYYTLTAFSVPIPQSMKRSLTTMQIIQFIVGVAYAAIHSFVSYTVPVQVADMAPSIKSAASVASSTISSVAAAASSAGVGNIVKKFLFRAAGEEGLAENVNGAAEQIAAIKSAHQDSALATSYHTEWHTVPCIDTSGQTFAVWLNVLYLAPLTALFVRFFIKSYIRRSNKAAAAKETSEKAGKGALKGVQRELYQNGGLNGRANGHANGHANSSPKKV